MRKITGLIFFLHFSIAILGQIDIIDTLSVDTNRDSIRKDTTKKYIDTSNVIFKIYLGFHNTKTRVVIQLSDSPLYDIKKIADDKLVVMLYNTVMGQSELKKEVELPFVRSVYVEEIGKRHSQVIILTDTNFVYKVFTLLRPYRLVIDIYPDSVANITNKYRNYIELGKKYFREKNYEEALKNFRIAAIEGNSTEAYYYAGIIRFEKKDYPKAIYNFSQALKDEKKFYDSYIYLSQISEDTKDFNKAIEYLDLYLRIAADTSKFPEIRKKRQYLQDIVDKIIKLDSIKAVNDSLRAKGKPQIDSAEVDSFLKAYGIKEDLKEQEPLKLFIWAKEYYDRDDYERAVKVLYSLIKLFPDSKFVEDSYLLLAKIYFKLMLYPQASKYAQLLYDVNPNTEFLDEILFILGKAYYYLGKYDDAIKYLRLFIQKFPDDKNCYWAHLFLARIYEKKNKPIIRDEEYDYALKLVPDEFSLIKLYRELADLYKGKNKLGKSIYYIKKIVEIFESKKEPQMLFHTDINYAIFTLPDLLFQNEQYDSALVYYKKLEEYFLREYPEKLDWVMFQIGNIYKIKKDYKNAIVYYNRVLENYKNSIWYNHAQFELDNVKWLMEIEPKIEELKKKKMQDG